MTLGCDFINGEGGEGPFPEDGCGQHDGMLLARVLDIKREVALCAVRYYSNYIHVCR